MNVEQVYEVIKGDYFGVKERMLTDERIQKYLIKFKEIASIDKFLAAMDEGNYKVAFEEIHNLKGMCANLSFNKLGGIAQMLTEALRFGSYDKNMGECIDNLREEFEFTINTINALD